jgi:hypothetical protein
MVEQEEEVEQQQLEQVQMEQYSNTELLEDQVVQEHQFHWIRFTSSIYAGGGGGRAHGNSYLQEEVELVELVEVDGWSKSS